jgi:hypothetical protein
MLSKKKTDGGYESFCSPAEGFFRAFSDSLDFSNNPKMDL